MRIQSNYHILMFLGHWNERKNTELSQKPLRKGSHIICYTRERVVGFLATELLDRGLWF
jgi:hypothetical protein